MPMSSNGFVVDPAPDTLTCVLLVEDETLIRMFVAEELIEQGFSVVEAASGDEAVALLTSGRMIDIVFSDVRMPGHVDGLGLLDFIVTDRPGLPVILCSGTLMPDEAMARGAADFIVKPYTTATVGAALTKVLNRSRFDR